MDVSEFLSTARRSLKLVLWYQLLDKRMYRVLIRFYWSVWTTSALLLVVSLLMLANHARAWPEYGPFLLWVAICVSLVAVGYVTGRVLGMLPLVVLSIVLPATLIISARGVRLSPQEIARNERSGFPSKHVSASSDLQHFTKGATVFFALAALAAAAYAACPAVHGAFDSRRCPPRRPATAALIVSGLAALEMLRIATRVWPDVAPPWYEPTACYLTESGWPYAIGLWLWLDVACLLAIYDTEVLPYLLHRMGHDWAPRRLWLADVHWIDQLLVGLMRPSSKDGSRATRHTHRYRH